ncbi:RHS repeat-associated core domain-containing protein [Rheinheimera texasensis]|uniref:RHS repeat-associated core domain-containing protein n=1 Tax=Rheinheimera texasensis TaxID=306205 RepID=UPI0032B0F10D
MQQRYYDPVIGRFYSNDPVGFSAGNPMMFNRYAYANNNPYKFTDPDGRNPFIVQGDSDNATLTRESFKEGGDMFVAGMEQAGEMLVDGYLEAGGLVPGIGGLAATAVAGVKELVTDGSVATLTGVVAGEMVGKTVEANVDIKDIEDLKGGKVAMAINAGKELGKFAMSKGMEWYVKEKHEKNEVKKGGSTPEGDKNK